MNARGGHGDMDASVSAAPLGEAHNAVHNAAVDPVACEDCDGLPCRDGLPCHFRCAIIKIG